VGELDAVDDNLAFLMLLKPVDAADQCRLAGARRAANNDFFALGYRELDIAQNMELAEPLIDADQIDSRYVRLRHGRDRGRRLNHDPSWAPQIHYERKQNPALDPECPFPQTD